MNKRIKCMEFGDTNMQPDRFCTIMKKMRMRQLYFPEKMLPSATTVTCSECHEVGHNKKSKHCPMHPQNVSFVFSDSEDES